VTRCKKEEALAARAPQPHWKADFSVDWDRTSYVTRREFTRFLALGSVAMAAGNTFMAARAAVKRPVEHPVVKVGGIEDVEPGAFKTFEYPSKGQHAILMRGEDGAYRAFSQRCPHLGCSVFYSEHSGKLECPCHEGFFDAQTGEVLAGPPQRGLAAIELEITEGKVFAVGGGEG
jgi:Rieske Fe-S protein